MVAIPTNDQIHHISKPGYSKLKGCGFLFAGFVLNIRGISKKLFNFHTNRRKKRTTKTNIAHCSNATGSTIILIVTTKTNWYLPSTDHLYLVQSEYYNSAGSENEAVTGTVPVHC